MTDYSKIEIVLNLVKETLVKMGFSNAEVSYEESITKGLVFNIFAGADSYLLIGRQGAHLQALQIVLGQIAQNALKEPFWFILDVDDYKMKREWFLKETARAAVEHIKKTGRAVALEPMPNFERRLVHAYVQENFPEAESVSIDREPYRKVVIRLKR
ncbi:MAG: R3H domain-containing nucleic acid-binding protein [Patescibacteria group bacterium]